MLYEGRTRSPPHHPRTTHGTTLTGAVTPRALPCSRSEFGDSAAVKPATMTVDQIAARAAERRRKEAERLAAQQAQILKDMQASTIAGAAGDAATVAAAAAPASAGADDVSVGGSDGSVAADAHNRGPPCVGRWLVCASLGIELGERPQAGAGTAQVRGVMRPRQALAAATSPRWH